MQNKFLITAPSVCDLNPDTKFSSDKYCYFVNDKQSLQIHKAVEQIAYYFKREGRFDFVQYTALEEMNSHNSNAYIWVEEDWTDSIAVGACGFRYLGDVGQIKDWSLEWVWMHPYRRCQGLLTNTWHAFVDKYGKDFHVAPPLSHEMEMFLKKIGHKIK